MLRRKVRALPPHGPLVSEKIGRVLNNRDLVALGKSKEATANRVVPPGSHASCMVCGNNSLFGLRFIAEKDSVIAFVQADPQWQGYSGVLHGGIVSTLLDAAMTHCLFHHGIEAMTASLKVRFREPAPCVGELQIRATLENQRRHVYLLDAELFSSGRCLARAEARFIRTRR